MTGYLFIRDEKIGAVDFKILAEAMGVIGGNLISNNNYEKYKPTIQAHFERSGISNVEDFDFRIYLDGVQLEPQGGSGVTESKDFDELLVEAGGLDAYTLNKIRTHK